MRRQLIVVLTPLLALAAVPAAAEAVRSVFAAADPFAIDIGGAMWIYPTGPGDRLQAWSSTDLVSWQRRGDLLRLKDIAWVRDDHALRHYLWAPDLLPADGKYFLYYSVGPQDPTPSRLGVAVCDTPAGPCADSGKPLLVGGQGFEAIDPMVFTDPKSGLRYLYAGGSNGRRLRVFELGADMVSIAREVAVEQPQHFTEGVWMHERGGTYYLSYSDGQWNGPSYSVHYSTAPTPTGPWQYRGVILQSDRKFKGPGHHAFVADPRDGTPLIVYHRWEGKHGDGPYVDDRRIAIQHITYAADGSILPISMGE